MAITNGTNVTALEKPAIGVDTGPGWATAINNSIDAVDGHDHSSNKGVRITPAGVNINADLDYNQNSAISLKNVIFNSTVTAATTAYSLYQASGNLFFRDGSGTAIQMTISGTVNAGAGSITGMTTGNPAATYADGSKTFNFFTDGTAMDYGKMAHADLILHKFTDDNVEDADYVTIAANAAVSGSSGTIYVPSENGTFLTTATSYATAAINVATSASNYPINLKPHGTGYVTVGNGGATGKLSSNGAYDLILATNSGSSSSSIVITDAADGSISFIPNGTGEIVMGSGSTTGKITSNGAHDLILDTNAGSSSSSIEIIDAADGGIKLKPNGTGKILVGSGSASGKITTNGAHDLILDTNAGTSSSSIKIIDAADGTIQLNTNGAGEVQIGNGGASAKISSHGAYDLVLDTNAGSSSSSITIVDAADGNIALNTNGTGKVVVGNGSAVGNITTSGAHNLLLDTNSGSSSSSIAISDAANGTILLNTDGTGFVQIGNGGATGKITTHGAYDLVLNTNAGSSSSSITITDAADGAITLATNGNGNVALTTGGTGEVVVGSGSASGKITSSGAHDLRLDTNAGSSSGSITITDAANGDITLACNGSGDIECSSDVKTSITKKVYSKGNCVQSSFHSSLIFGY